MPNSRRFATTLDRFNAFLGDGLMGHGGELESYIEHLHQNKMASKA
jgi:hypothetical protein